MTDIRHTNEARVHQPRGGGDSFRSSCNSTPEPHNLHTTYTTSTTERNTTNGHTPLLATLTNGRQRSGYRKPLLQSLADHVNMSSTSGGSSSSSTATATTAQRCNGYNGGGGEIQFDERDIYYVSPSKRKTVNSSSYCAASSASLRLKSTSSIAPSYPPITPSAAYGARAGGPPHDFSFDSYETASHYSDTAMQLLRSGSGSATTGIINNLLTMRDCSSSNSSLTLTQPTRQTTNVVTFSSPLDEERPALPMQQQQQHNNRGSLRRSKGRSNQSLCSCDAGADTEINPDPTRPLYQYSLERRHKGHTYTCEQNAQILMRLGRERNRRLSLQGGGASSSKDDVQSDTPSSSDVDAIPPVPPPPVIIRNGSMRSLRHYPHSISNITSTLYRQPQKQQQLQRPSSTSNQSNSIATLCTSDGSSGNNLLNDCANNVLEVGSLIDDCTTSILKCANAVGTELMAVTASGGNAGSTTHKATLATMASSAKPDVCHVAIPYSQQQQQQQSHCIHDDIFAPSSKKSDPSLCFLHVTADTKTAMPRSILSASGKYNTIGPTSDYARQLAAYSLAQQQQLESAAPHCRCLSQSLSNFSRDYFGHSGHKGPNRDVHMQHIFYTDHHDWLKEPPPPPPPTTAHISRSYGNLMDIGGGDFSSSQLPYQKFHTPAAHVSSCSFGSGGGSAMNGGSGKLFNNSFTASLTSASSGLKEKLLQHQQQQHPHLHHGHQHGHHHSHHQQQQQQASSAAQQHKQQQQMQHLHSSVTSIMPWKHRQCPSRGSSSSGTNSFRFDAAKHWLAVSSILLIIGAASVAVPLALRVAASAPFEERLRVAVQLLDQVPLIDGHNDLPWNIRKFLHNKLNDFNFDEDLRNVMPWARSPWSHTDLQRLKKGRISAQFWAAYVPCEAQHRDAVQLTLEQIDVIKRLTDRYAPQLITCTSAEDIIEAHKNHQLCSLTGVEGGHSLGGSLAVLRTLYAIGVRYMTLTSTCHTPWADSSNADAPTFNVKHGGLTIFGKTIIREMNRLGMMVDLSKVSTGTMRDALEVSEAPVIFSHSSAYELCNSSRNVQDDMLQSLSKNGGLVMVNFYSKFLSCSENSTVHDAVAHINHIKRIAGIDHVGLGAGFDGINFTPKGLEDVSSYPTLFAELLGVGWSIEDLTKLAGGNFLRVMQRVEKVRDEKKTAGVKPFEDHPNFRTDDPYNCTSS